MGLATVQEWQIFYGMSPRNDSALTVKFEREELPFHNARSVARELVATHFIFRETLYGEVIEDYMRAVAERLRSTYRLSWGATWEIVRFYAPIALKLMMVWSSKLRIPKFLRDRNSASPGP